MEREMSILSKAYWRSNYWFLTTGNTIASPHPPSCFLHFFTFISFQCFLASSLLFQAFLLTSCCSSPELLTHCLVPPLLSLQHLPLPRLYSTSLDHYLRGLSVSFPYLQAGRGGGSFLYEKELSVGRHLTSNKPRELHFHVWCPLSPLVGGSLPFQGDTGSRSLKFWVMDVSSGYQGNF